jgi:hypothetical protein
MAHVTHATMRFPRSHAAVNGPGRDRTPLLIALFPRRGLHGVCTE